MKQYCLLLCFLSVGVISFGQVPKHLFFENSELPFGFARSVVSYQGNSWVRNYQHRLPVNDTVFFTPGNALELSYRSDPHGTWQVDLYTNVSNGLQVKPSEQLCLRVQLPLNMPEEALPQLQLLQENEYSTKPLPLQAYLRKNPDGPWSKVQIPLDDFEGFQPEQALLALRFQQAGKGDKEYTLYLDQVEILPERLPGTKLTGAAVLSSVKAYQRHAVLKWKLPLTPSIRYIQVYRSSDNKNFVPIGIRSAPAMTYTDILPDTSKTYYYKIAWVDYDFQHSPFSQVKALKSKAMKPEELLNMVQKAHIRYYLSGEEYNSGLQRVSRRSGSTRVSTKGSGMGLLALLVGVRQQMLTRDQYREKVDRICDFLLTADTFQGAFPAVIDGKTGEAITEKESLASADLEATAYLVQGLLVAREYFRDNSEADAQLRAKIDTIWRNVEWNKFKKEGEHYLYSSWTPATGFAKAHPISGAQSLPIYLLAMASPTHNIDIEDYAQGMAQPLIFQATPEQPTDSVSRQQRQLQDTLSSLRDAQEEGQWTPQNYINEAVYYGIPLKLKKENLSLPEMLMAFSAFDPRGKEDEFVNYYDEIHNLIHIQLREKDETPNQSLVLTGGLRGGTVDQHPDQLDFNSDVALYAFAPEIAWRNLRTYYDSAPELSWSSYGFKSRLDLKKNRYLHVDDVSYKALVPVMIENGKTGMIWDLFMQVPEIQSIMKSLFIPDPTRG